MVERVLGKDEVMGPSPISSFPAVPDGAASEGARLRRVPSGWWNRADQVEVGGSGDILPIGIAEG